MSRVTHLTINALLWICVSLLFVAPLKAADCSSVLPSYFQWSAEKQGQTEGSHAIGVKMGVVKIRETDPMTYPWGHGFYSEGRLAGHGDDMTGRLTVLFSDQKSPDGKYRFNPQKSNIQDITVFKDGRIRIVLRNWGDAQFFLENVACYPDGFITGIMREGNGVSLVTLVIRKEVILPARDGFRNWP
jgi:hypothetical protein